MTTMELNNSNTVEVDGIRFETIMPERILTIPASLQERPTLVELGIRITNNTSNALQFCLYDAIIPELMTPDGKILRQESYFSDWLEAPVKSDFPIAMPGEAVSFLPGGAIWRWNDEYFQFTIAVGNGGSWLFQLSQLGTYQLRFEYINTAKKRKVRDPDILKTKLIENIWTGVVLLPFVEFRLLRPQYN